MGHRENGAQMTRNLGDEVWWPFEWFQLFLQTGCNFSLFLYCLFKPSLHFNSQHIHHWYLLAGVGCVSLAMKRILSKTEGFAKEVKCELS